jgi:hypothetical protein
MHTQSNLHIREPAPRTIHKDFAVETLAGMRETMFPATWVAAVTAAFLAVTVVVLVSI